ncbi:MAG TPA: hypothetical protein VNA12_00260 [Mycobacteriales bacterium]|nr:hypothetical protein [Mycobacteriales bacterium]
MTRDRVTCAVIEVVDGSSEVATVTITGAVPQLFVVDAVARLRAAAQPLGWSVRLREPSAPLAEVVELAGLRVQLCGQSERSEERGVEEVVQLDEPPR